MDKRDALAALVLPQNRANLENKLFFAARNLAIEAMLLRLETLLLREGYPAACSWHESSMQAPSVYIQMRVSAPGAEDEVVGTCTLWLNRERVSAPEALSDCFYSVKSFSETEYWRGRQPAKLVKFRARVQELFQTGYLSAAVEKVNYPFEYPGLSQY